LEVILKAERRLSKRGGNLRKLAVVKRISKVEQIPKADRLEKYTIDGWEIVDGKGRFKPNDLVIYFEIDSLIPLRFEELKQYCSVKSIMEDGARFDGYRIKTIKLRGQISQGLIMSLDVVEKKYRKEGVDVSDIIGVKKYEVMDIVEEPTKWELLAKKYKFVRYILNKFFKQRAKGGFPAFIHKTDEERIQNMTSVCDRTDIKFHVTEKLDGCSATFYVKDRKKFWNRYLFGQCSRNRHTNDRRFTAVVKRYGLKKILTDLVKETGATFVSLQGEILAPNLQKNKYGVKEPDFYVFNYIVGGKNKPTEVQVEICERFGLKHVPVLDTEFVMKPIHEMVTYSDSTSVLCGIKREGIVLRNYEENISFKVINPNFLIQYDE